MAGTHCFAGQSFTWHSPIPNTYLQRSLSPSTSWYPLHSPVLTLVRHIEIFIIQAQTAGLLSLMTTNSNYQQKRQLEQVLSTTLMKISQRCLTLSRGTTGCQPLGSSGVQFRQLAMENSRPHRDQDSLKSEFDKLPNMKKKKGDPP